MSPVLTWSSPASLPPDLVKPALKSLARPAAVGLLVVDHVHLALLQRVVGVVGREAALEGVGGGGAEVGLERAGLGGLPVLALGQLGRGVGRRDLDETCGVEDLLHLGGDAGVQRADHAEDLVVLDELGGVGLAGGRDGLVVERLDLEGHAGNGVVLVGVVDGDLDAALDAEAGGGVLTSQRRVHADDDLGLLVALAVAAVVARAAGGQRECSCREHGGEYDHRTLSHVESSPWRGTPGWGPCFSPGRTG